MIIFGTLVLLALLSFVLAARGGLSGVARARKYKSGTGWCFWRWTDVESEYILRLHVVKTPWFAVCLHWIRKPDKEPYLHDHPVSFLSIVLRGKYAELRASGDGDIGHRVHTWFNFIRANRRTDRHRIIFTRSNTLTLCFMGPKTREWGFHMPEGWVGWKAYYARLKAGENMRYPTLAEERILHHYDRLAREQIEPGVLGPRPDFDDEAPTEPREIFTKKSCQTCECLHSVPSEHTADGLSDFCSRACLQESSRVKP